ncbi:(2Fe-2S)-binding protein [Pseudooceanicola onchidii]|uniref:(2Fe-2S)-binding protein n=1 Tax=Pseudooceanicola onchidii TaxID=2562279 RepID=UPI0010AA32FD|nr:(2Fe-2S)-binding protein [Pseudooceanicola onchidii]
MSDGRVSFTLNGEPVEIEAPEAEPLLWTLRNRLGLTGARFGCGEGSCGACAVLVDGQIETSCSLKLWAVEGRRVETVEGLGDHPLIAAFAAERAGQCGYCLSGLVMRAKGLLDNTPDPDRAEIIAALDEGLCRCGAHPRILRAVARAAEDLRG